MQEGGISMVLELDVPAPLPYLTIPSSGGGVRVPFYTVELDRPTEQEAHLAAVNAHYSVMEQIEQMISGGILWWACRPIVEPKQGRYRALMRIGTSPELPADFWRKLAAA